MKRHLPPKLTPRRCKGSLKASNAKKSAACTTPATHKSGATTGATQCTTNSGTAIARYNRTPRIACPRPRSDSASDLPPALRRHRLAACARARRARSGRRRTAPSPTGTTPRRARRRCRARTGRRAATRARPRSRRARRRGAPRSRRPSGTPASAPPPATATRQRRRQEHERQQARRGRTRRANRGRSSPFRERSALSWRRAHNRFVTFLFLFGCSGHPVNDIPQTDVITNPALAGSVDLVRDAVGHPAHLRRSAADVAFVQGYVTAEDRLVQMELFAPRRRGHARRAPRRRSPPTLSTATSRCALHHFTRTCTQAWQTLSSSTDPDDQTTAKMLDQLRRRRQRLYRRPAGAEVHAAAGAGVPLLPATLKPWTEVDSLVRRPAPGVRALLRRRQRHLPLAARGGGDRPNFDDVERRRPCTRARASAPTSRSWRRTIRPTRCRRAGRA